MEFVALLLLAPLFLSDGTPDGSDRNAIELTTGQSSVARVERSVEQTVFHPPENKQLTLTVLLSKGSIGTVDASSNTDLRSPAGFSSGSIEIVVSAP